MRRKDREVTSAAQIAEIIKAYKVFRLAMAVDNEAYIVPLNFGYEEINGIYTFYFHCAAQGKKLDMLKKNSNICFEMDCAHSLTRGNTPCEYGYNFGSVIGKGTAVLLTNYEEKAHGLSLLMLHQAGESHAFTPREAYAVTVYKICTEELTAKRRKA